MLSYIFSENALNDAKELADIYYKKGFIDVEAKSGQHHGTYKVFVNYPVAILYDISDVSIYIYYSYLPSPGLEYYHLTQVCNLCWRSRLQRTFCFPSLL